VIEMKVLHVLKSEPDEILKTLMGSFAESNEVQEFEMHKGDVDYDKLIEPFGDQILDT
jgi:hypothetical protein